MTIPESDWNDANVAHIARHGVKPHEAEEVILNDPIDLAVASRNGEERIEQIGETTVGRILRVVSTLRQNKIRVITAVPLRTKRYSWYFNLKEQLNAGNKNST